MIQKKICLLGEFAVGKTSLVRRFVEGRFDDRYLSTIGVKVSRRSVMLGEQQVNLLIWDLAGGESFTGLQAGYLQGASGALLVCDLTRRDTLDALQRYADQLRAVNPQAALILVGNKSDLAEQREVSDDMLAALGRTLNAPWFVTSAKTGAYVAEAFTELAQAILRQSA